MKLIARGGEDAAAGSALKRGTLVTFDGFAASGKSTCAGIVSAELGWPLLSTGSAHRLNATLIVENMVDFHDQERLADYLANLDLRFEIDNSRMIPVLAGRRPGAAGIHDAEVRKLLPQVTSIPLVCQTLAERFRAAVQGRLIVAEGHGLGTGIFPDANHKFFCTAPVEIRARRRWEQEAADGLGRSLGDVLAEISCRDHSDAERAVNPVRYTSDMIVLDTAVLTTQQCADIAVAVISASEQEGS